MTRTPIQVTMSVSNRAEGHHTTVILADSTKVYIGLIQKLYMTTPYPQQSTYGLPWKEAYFESYKDKEKPFIIKQMASII